MSRRPLRRGGWTAVIRAFLLCCFGFGPFAAAAGAAAAGTAAGQVAGVLSDGRRTGVLLFLSSQAAPGPACDLARVHEAAWDELGSLASRLGAGAVSRADVEPLVRWFRVRSSLGVSGAFLDSLAAAFDCEQVLVVDVAIHADRLMLAGRVSSTWNRELLWASVAESDLPTSLASERESDPAPWVAAIRHGCEELLAPAGADARTGKGALRAPASAAGAAPWIFVLPVRTSGLDASLAGLVDQCLLGSLMGRQWRIQDPGVTYSLLRAAGIDPNHLDPRARAELTAGVPGALIIGNVATYEDARPAVTQEDEELPTLSRSLLPPFSLSIRWIEGQSGEVVAAATTYIGDGKARGLFGVPRNPSPVRRVQRATDQLVHVSQEKG